MNFYTRGAFYPYLSVHCYECVSTPFVEKAVRKTILASDAGADEAMHASQATYNNILSYTGDLVFPASPRYEVSDNMKSFILALLAPQPSDRPTANTLLDTLKSKP